VVSTNSLCRCPLHLFSNKVGTTPPSHSELSHACDVPTSLSNSLRPHQLIHLCCKDKLIPFKVVLRLLDGICTLTYQSTPINNHQGRTKHQCVQSSVHDQPCSIANIILTSPEADEIRSSKAVKSENAPVPVHLWNHAIVTESDPLYTEKISALNQLCLLALRWWKKRLLKEFVTWYKTKHSLRGFTSKSSLVDMEAGRDCITRAPNSS
jgi:hypothetical protein